MATRNLTVIAVVKDAASSSLKKIATSFNETSRAVRKSSVDFTEFNRVLFSTSAFIGLFSKSFDKMVNSLNQASELDRISEQFERVMGPKGSLFQSINGMTKNSIDRMEAMKSGISLGTLGIVKDTRSLAEIVARAGTAAKRAGFQSGEGIKRVTDFLKDGSIANLSFLNVLSATNPQLQAQMAILQRAGGVMGTVISTQAKLRLGMAALRAATQGMESDQRDLMDVMRDAAQSFSFLKGEIGRFLGKALTPVIEKVTEFADSFHDLIERIRKTDPALLTTVKNLFLVGSALTSVIATLGTARLVFKALGALGIGGIPFITMSLLGLAAAFTDVQKATESFTSLAKSVGAVLLGSFQLFNSFVQDADNFSKGIGKMDSQLHEFLQKQGLLELTKNIARVSAIIITFTKDVGNTLVDWFKQAAEFIDPLIKKIAELFGKSDPKGWARSWIEGTGGIRRVLVKLTAGAVATFGAFKALQIGKGLLSKIPVIGKIFGGGGLGKGPSGTAGDPIYTKDVNALGGTTGLLSGGLKNLFPTFGKLFDSFRSVTISGLSRNLGGEAVKVLFRVIMQPLGAIISIILNPMTAFKLLIESITHILSSFISGMGTAVSTLSSLTILLFAALSAVGSIKGIFEGLSETGSGFIDFFKSIGHLANAVYESISNFLQANTVFQTVTNALKAVGLAFIDSIKWVFNHIVEGWKQIAGWMGIGMEVLSGKINQSALTTNLQTASTLKDQTQVMPLANLGLAKSTKGGLDIASVPVMPENESMKLAVVQEAISRLTKSGNTERAAALGDALKIATADSVITPEEWEMIFANGMNKAQVTDITKKQAEKQPPVKHMTAKRC